MADNLDPGLTALLRAESEATKDESYPAGTVGERPDGNRSKVYSVRLSAEEQGKLRKLADFKYLPPSTLVWSWLLERLEHERSAKSSIGVPRRAYRGNGLDRFMSVTLKRR